MQYFFDCVETIPDGIGWAHYSPLHLTWLAAIALTVLLGCLLYRRLDPDGRRKMRYILAGLTVGNEIFKMWLLMSQGNYYEEYLPLHLCSINIFVVLWHALRPNENVGAFLYTVCVPGAIAALLFPTWNELPLLCGMHIHSFTVHAELVLYPLMLVAGGEVHPRLRQIPKILGLLVLSGIPAIIVNHFCSTNFMFLRYAEPGNPLLVFEQLFGNHLIGIPILISIILVVLYTPWVIADRRKAKKTTKV